MTGKKITRTMTRVILLETFISDHLVQGVPSIEIITWFPSSRKHLDSREHDIHYDSFLPERKITFQ